MQVIHLNVSGNPNKKTNIYFPHLSLAVSTGFRERKVLKSFQKQ